MDEAAGEVLLAAGGGLQLLDVPGNGVGHAVEVSGQLADLIAAHDPGAGGIVPLGQLVGGPAQTADRGGQPIGEGEHHRAADPHH